MSSTGQKLWTRDFTIITVGTVVSMFGNTLSGFAMSLMVLDVSKSTPLYAIYLSMYTIPQLLMPLVSGAVLDRTSRKKTIYTLDFISAGLYALMAVILSTGWFSFPFFAAYCFILGTIESTYMVAYDSFYPLLISEGNFQKAYSIASVLETMSAVLVPVSAVVYKTTGIAPLMVINAVCFFAAAVMETQIKADEEYIEAQKSTRLEGAGRLHQVIVDLKEGFGYLRGEKGLLAITVYFGVSTLCGCVTWVLTLPYFKANYENGEFVYMLVWGMNVVGRMIGGGIHYKTVLPAKYRFSIAFLVYVVIAILEGTYLFMPIPVMMVFCFIVGIGGVTSYTIRIAATQSYVPDEKKGRFNGAFNMLNTVGALGGELFAGLMSIVMSERIVILIVMMFNALAAVVIMGGARHHVSKIYNRLQ